MPALGQVEFGRVIGGASRCGALSLCERLAQSDVPVVIEGETGQAKKRSPKPPRWARARRSVRRLRLYERARPLMESEPSVTRRARSPARSRRAKASSSRGRRTLSSTRSAILDLALQPKLLAPSAEIRRVGGDRPIRSTCVFCSNAARSRSAPPLAIREDLFTVGGRRIEPPLRKRRGDIAVLARHYWSSLGGDEGGPPPICPWERESARQRARAPQHDRTNRARDLAPPTRTARRAGRHRRGIARSSFVRARKSDGRLPAPLPRARPSESGGDNPLPPRPGHRPPLFSTCYESPPGETET